MASFLGLFSYISFSPSNHRSQSIVFKQTRLLQGCNAQTMTGERIRYPVGTSFSCIYLLQDIVTGTYDLFFDGISFCPVRFPDELIKTEVKQAELPATVAIVIV
jgi:hypothetical protein